MKKENVQSFVIAIFLTLLFCTYSLKCCSQEQNKQTHSYDTIPARTTCIQKFVTKKTKKGSAILAVYVDQEKQIVDLIPVSNTVFQYIVFCNENGIQPQIAIKLRDREIYSLIKAKKKL